MTPDPGREHMMGPRPPLTLGPPEAAECERCGDPAERRARFWQCLLPEGVEPDDDALDGPPYDDFDLCDTCFLLWAKASDMTPEESLEFWSHHDDGEDD